MRILAEDQTRLPAWRYKQAVKHIKTAIMARVLLVACALLANTCNAFAPVASPATRAAVRVQVGVPRIDLPAQVVLIQRP